MPFLWSMNLDDYMEIMKRAKANGKKPGDSMEEEMHEYAREKGIKPLGATDFTIDELLRDAKSKGKNPISIEHDENGKEIIKYIKKDDKNDRQMP